MKDQGTKRKTQELRIIAAGAKKRSWTKKSWALVASVQFQGQSIFTYTSSSLNAALFFIAIRHEKNILPIGLKMKFFVTFHVEHENFYHSFFEAHPSLVTFSNVAKAIIKCRTYYCSILLEFMALKTFSGFSSIHYDDKCTFNNST